MTLEAETLTRLRALAQSLGHKNPFGEDRVKLIQYIQLQQEQTTPKREPVPPVEYDARLMTKPPAKKSTVNELEILLEPYKKRGLHVRYDEERWYFRYDRRTDEGPLRMPLRSVLRCADAIIR